MTTNNYNYGDQVTQYGANSTGIVKNYGPRDPGAALQDMIAAVQLLREQVPSEDRDAIDQSLRVIESENAEKGAVRRALSNLAGIAVAVGTAGVPALESVRAVLELVNTM
ncbi:hypothetical protein BX285_6995 [Streptomyces sp. 1114.5]|uniref:hypothetical protein n=1 Tax=Streptomyces sp. 1114.5 TaxID=1938830 RepID=UPI000EB0ACC4|nr:hypothetical protein [Streptomyces sp. 1114.5]RKT09879.1 hypothetical protein BX285_6995 [Streptomyces sp. 1114.5]